VGLLRIQEERFGWIGSDLNAFETYVQERAGVGFAN
jgi:hypothetical protein